MHQWPQLALIERVVEPYVPGVCTYTARDANSTGACGHCESCRRAAGALALVSSWGTLPPLGSPKIAEF